jgi:hypothetical protein
MGFRPERVTTDGHGSYPKAIRSVLGRRARHRTSAYLNNRLEQDHRGIKGRIRCMRGFKRHDAASRFCREHGELRNLLRPRLPPPLPFRQGGTRCSLHHAGRMIAPAPQSRCAQPGARPDRTYTRGGERRVWATEFADVWRIACSLAIPAPTTSRQTPRLAKPPSSVRSNKPPLDHPFNAGGV